MDTQTVFRFLFMVALVFHEVNLKTPLIKPWLVSIHFCKSDDTCDRSGKQSPQARLCTYPGYPDKYFWDYEDSGPIFTYPEGSDDYFDYLPCDSILTSVFNPNNTGEYVSFQQTNKLELGHRVDCTGVLVSTKYIITSDHCVSQATQNERIELVAGSGHSQNSQIRQAKKVWPSQKPKSYIGQDVAFLEVIDDPFKIIFGSVQPAKMVADTKAKFRKPLMGFMGPHRRCWTFMWLQGNELFVDPMKIVKKDVCKKKYRNEELGWDQKWDQTLCTQTFRRSNSVAFGDKPGDFGAPLVCDFPLHGPDHYFEPMLSGIASMHPINKNIYDQSNRSNPIVYTKVAYFVDVLKTLLKEGKEDTKIRSHAGRLTEAIPYLVIPDILIPAFLSLHF